jgi:hypothetical protein
MTQSPDSLKPDLAFARQHIRGFAELKEKIDRVKEDEARYKAGDCSHRNPEQQGRSP